MMNHEQAIHTRKTLTGASMVLAPICFVITDSLWPVTHTKAAQALADVTGNTGRLAWGLAFGLAGCVFFLAAALGLAHMLNERRPGLAIIGAGLSSIGVMAVATLVSVSGMVAYEAVPNSRNRTTMVDLYNGMLKGPIIPLAIAAELFSIGIIILAVGLARARVIATWQSVVLVLAALAVGTGNITAAKPIILAADTLLLAGLGSIGVTVLAETDADWQHSPDVHGLTRPAVV